MEFQTKYYETKNLTIEVDVRELMKILSREFFDEKKARMRLHLNEYNIVDSLELISLKGYYVYNIHPPEPEPEPKTDIDKVA